MRPLILSIGCWAALAATGLAQTSDVNQLPVGQIYKDFQFPLYQDGQLKFTLAAAQAKGITINRAETTDVKIDLYENGKKTTTITSPKADIYVADRKMRTRNTVRIERADMEATAQICDFDLISKQYLLRTNVKVTLKNFDTSLPGSAAAHPKNTLSTLPPGSAVPVAPASAPPVSGKSDSLLESPGAYSSTNSAPPPP
jgi:hypothetical protein